MLVKDIYYLAGLFEGEGCFSIQKQGKSKYPLVQCVMTDPEPLARAARLLYGKVLGPYQPKQNKDYRPYYRLQFTGPKAIGVMLTLFSLLSPRRKEAIKKALKASTLKYKTNHARQVYCDYTIN